MHWFKDNNDIRIYVIYLVIFFFFHVVQATMIDVSLIQLMMQNHIGGQTGDVWIIYIEYVSQQMYLIPIGCNVPSSIYLISDPSVFTLDE